MRRKNEMAFWNRKRTEIRAEPEVNLKESDPDTIR